MRTILHDIRAPEAGRHIEMSRIRRILGRKNFSLGEYRSKAGDLQYGITPCGDDDDDGTSNKPGKVRRMLENLDHRLQSIKGKKETVAEKYSRLLARRLWDQIALISFLHLITGFFILILHYETTTLDTPFERFFNNQEFGIRFIFAGLGAVISLFWEAHFSRIARLSPYHRPNPQIFTSPPTTPYTTLFTAPTQKNYLLSAIAFIAILSKFAPILLSNIPFRNVQT
ncbi:hypothetical protein B0T14DRAFT_561697 [Immersiella caudata]|uniref:Uncharacterized protein n=1 Tax=Immersiella caudata TaxID=314043 RepID=A0AA39XJ10_9PEZI|nr:hypothetical protein B0T14DRAFT_561697 [Immersiella caudata]